MKRFIVTLGILAMIGAAQAGESDSVSESFYGFKPHLSQAELERRAAEKASETPSDQAEHNKNSLEAQRRLMNQLNRQNRRVHRRKQAAAASR